MESKPSLVILIAHERADRLAQVTAAVTELGHEVIERKIGIIDVGQATIESRPDVAIVIVGSRFGASGPAVDRPDRQGGGLSGHRDLGRAGSGVHQRSGEARYLRVYRGWPRPGGAAELDRHRAPAVRRVSRLEGAFGRRAVTERAKGILMERHGIDEQAAFNMLREHARRNNRKMVEVAEEVVSTHQLLPGRRSKASRGARDA